MRRLARNLVVFALLGGVLSYVIAWAIEVIATTQERADAGWEWRVLQAEVWPVLCYGFHRNQFPYPGILYDRDVGTVIAVMPHEQWKEGSRLYVPLAWAVGQEGELIAAQGWPLRSIRWEERGDQSRGRWIARLPEEHPLGFQPYWPGLLANTAFYGAILWGLWFTPGAMKRMMRRWRGRCTGCGYDLRGGGQATCPECGAG